MTRCYIGLGSNLENPATQLNNALVKLDNLPLTNIIAVSSYYNTKPYGVVNQPDFTNAVAEIETQLPPLDLLKYLKQIEQQLGRKPSKRWGPRIIDLDILLYGQEIIELPSLTIPHKELTKRDFVLIPLAELNPQLILPDGQPIQKYTILL